MRWQGLGGSVGSGEAESSSSAARWVTHLLINWGGLYQSSVILLESGVGPSSDAGAEIGGGWP